MPGRPKTREDRQRLQEDQELQTLIFQMLEAGKSYTDICKATELAKGPLIEWLESPEHSDALARARARAASSMVEEARDIADELPKRPSNGQVNRAKLRIGVRQWIAERWNRPVYGQKVEHQVSGQVTVMHLEALKRRAQLVQRVDPALPHAQPAQVIDSIEGSVPHTGSDDQ